MVVGFAAVDVVEDATVVSGRVVPEDFGDDAFFDPPHPESETATTTATSPVKTFVFIPLPSTGRLPGFNPAPGLGGREPFRP